MFKIQIVLSVIWSVLELLTEMSKFYFNQYLAHLLLFLKYICVSIQTAP